MRDLNKGRFRATVGGSTILAGLLIAALVPTTAAAISFTNATTLAPADHAVVSSTINVAGQPAVTDVNVTLNQLGHTFPADLDVLVEGPTGVRVLLMSDVPSDLSPACDVDVANLVLIFDDAAASGIPLGAALASGTYKPTNNDVPVACGDVGDTFLGVAPTATTLSAFNGTDPNGNWKLYVADDAMNDAGSIAQGWTLELNKAPPPPPPPPPPGPPADVPDTAAPETTITKKPTKKHRKRSIVRFESSEPGSTFNCILDGSDGHPCSSPQNYADLDPGRHSFIVAATDGAGNTDVSPAGTRFFLSDKR
ncbi:MAG: hypothetical protein QOG62_1121 [Thermoleophilaceae bacterium]|nr:hypothetical protein [Thermoleophilaceae bacterium]